MTISNWCECNCSKTSVLACPPNRPRTRAYKCCNHSVQPGNLTWKVRCIFANCRVAPSVTTRSPTSSLFLLCCRQNLFPEALELFREAIRMRKSLLGDDDSSVGDIYLAMGILYDKMQSYDEAMSALEECMKIRSHQTTGNALPLAMVLTHIGIVHGNRADFSAALSCWDDALALYKQCGLPDEDPAVMAVQSYKVKAKEMLEKMMFRMVLQ